MEAGTWASDAEQYGKMKWLHINELSDIAQTLVKYNTSTGIFGDNKGGGIHNLPHPTYCPNYRERFEPQVLQPGEVIVLPDNIRSLARALQHIAYNFESVVSFNLHSSNRMQYCRR